jgi:hypothetical protein
MKKLLLFILMIFCLLQNVISQTGSPKGFDCLRINATTEGKRFEDKRYFKFFAVLLQDTCSTFNRFTNYFYSTADLKNNLPQKYYRATIIDPLQAIMAEKAIKNLSVDLHSYIRLYAGFVNDKNDTCIVVQFLKRKEYRKDKFYSKQMNLIAQKNRKLYFMVLEKRGNDVTAEKYFPNDFFKR